MVQLAAMQEQLASMQRSMAQQQQVNQVAAQITTLQAQQMQQQIAPLLSQTPSIMAAQALLAQQMAAGGGMAVAGVAQPPLALQPSIESQYVPASRLGSEMLPESSDADKLIQRMQSSAREAVSMAREGLASLTASPANSMHGGGAASVRTSRSGPSLLASMPRAGGGGGLRAILAGSVAGGSGVGAGAGLQPLSPNSSQGGLSDESMSI